jgi:hypothetical protein
MLTRKFKLTLLHRSGRVNAESRLCSTTKDDARDPLKAEEHRIGGGL